MKCEKCGQSVNPCDVQLQDAFGRNITVLDVLLYLRPVDIEDSNAVEPVVIMMDQINTNPQEWKIRCQDVKTEEIFNISGSSGKPTPYLFRLDLTPTEVWRY